MTRSGAVVVFLVLALGSAVVGLLGWLAWNEVFGEDGPQHIEQEGRR